MLGTYYHATSLENATSIANDGCIKQSFEGIVYLCKTSDDAIKFAMFRANPLIVFEVLVDEANIEETFDHSEVFFKCKAYGHQGDITMEQVTDIKQYSF